MLENIILSTPAVFQLNEMYLKAYASDTWKRGVRNRLEEAQAKILPNGNLLIYIPGIPEATTQISQEHWEYRKFLD